MARVTIYKNSILATICSLFGYGFTLMSVLSLIRGELGILEGIVMLAIGIGMSVLGGFISTRKAKKQQAKAGNAPAAKVSQVQHGQKMEYSGQAATVQFTPAPVKEKKPVKAAAVLTAIFFLLAFLLALLANYLYTTNNTLYWYFMELNVLEYGSCILLALAAIRMRFTQKVPVLSMMGLIGLLAGQLLNAQNCYLMYGFDETITPIWQANVEMFQSLFEAAGTLILLLMALLSTTKAKQSCGGFVRLLWWLPALPCGLTVTKFIVENPIIDIVLLSIENNQFKMGPDKLYILAKVLMVLGMLLLGYCFRRICKKGEPVYQPAQQPAAPVQPRPAAPAQPVAQRPVQQTPVQQQPAVQRPVQQQPVQPVAYAQPVMQRTVQDAPVQAQDTPRQATAAVNPQPVQAQGNQQDIEKKRAAYKDLLDCGILTQEEYDQKMRELTQC